MLYPPPHCDALISMPCLRPIDGRRIQAVVLCSKVNEGVGNESKKTKWNIGEQILHWHLACSLGETQRPERIYVLWAGLHQYSSVGALIQKDSLTDQDLYVIPLCDDCNKKLGQELEIWDTTELVSADAIVTKRVAKR